MTYTDLVVGDVVEVTLVTDVGPMPVEVTIDAVTYNKDNTVFRYHAGKKAFMPEYVRRVVSRYADVATENSNPQDAVNSPSHYTAYPGIEVIQLTEHMNFCLGNAVKYCARAGLKDPSKTVEDLKKAVWYIEREISRLEQAE